MRSKEMEAAASSSCEGERSTPEKGESTSKDLLKAFSSRQEGMRSARLATPCTCQMKAAVRKSGHTSHIAGSMLGVVTIESRNLQSCFKTNMCAVQHSRCAPVWPDG